jgi:hypothetical protein
MPIKAEIMTTAALTPLLADTGFSMPKVLPEWLGNAYQVSTGETASPVVNHVVPAVAGFVKPPHAAASW